MGKWEKGWMGCEMGRCCLEYPACAGAVLQGYCCPSFFQRLATLYEGCWRPLRGNWVSLKDQGAKRVTREYNKNRLCDSIQEDDRFHWGPGIAGGRSCIINVIVPNSILSNDAKLNKMTHSTTK